MANYERYQTLASAEQYLFSPSSPVWVNRYQVSWDMQTSARLLQCRMVNVSDKAITAVYLRVLCRDNQGQDITTLHMVPVTGLYVPPGNVFGDDQVITLWPNRTNNVEIYPERVCFSDNTAWNETEPSDYVAFPAPTPVQVQDVNYPRLSRAAREGGVKNEFYFRALKNVWICTCGVPNSNQTLYCRHCRADRSWLEKNMDPELAPALPELPAPKEEPGEPEQTPELEAFDLSSYMIDSPAQIPVAEEFPYIETYPSREDAEDVAPEKPAEKKKSNAGRTVAILLALLLFLGVAGVIAYQQLLGPNATYQKAIRAENEGEYTTAIGLYETLGDYEDCPDRILICRAMMAIDEMRQGNYEQAYAMFSELSGEFFETYPEYAKYMPDCLYSAGVTAYNEGDYDTAWNYVNRLTEEYADYAGTEQLRQCTVYEFGKRAIEQADNSYDLDARAEAYREAKNWFAQASGYSNSSDMVNLCDYYLADATYQRAQQDYDTDGYLRAADEFGALGDYSDSSQRRLGCLYAYCEAIYDLSNPDCARYLDELIAQDYPGALELQNELSVLEAEIEVLYVDYESEKPLPRELTTAEMQHVRIRYTIDGVGSSSMQILLVYTLPGAESSSVVLNPDDGRNGEIKLYDLIRDEATEAGIAKLQFYNSATGEELCSVEIEVVLATE